MASPSVKGDAEKLPMEAQGNGTYTVYWTPMAIGYYDVKVEVDGYPLTKQVRTVEMSYDYSRAGITRANEYVFYFDEIKGQFSTIYIYTRK